ncbi:hypothetical protein ACFQGE_08000 [Halomicroarcula sp. GCM10025817]|uniref:DUF7269 family protein n=1 Tax=Haloarcula TaxID=2237 RepID=UPI0023E7561A|nr:hypothetical protein [Halomicroarcula sp. SYNS111]
MSAADLRNLVSVAGHGTRGLRRAGWYLLVGVGLVVFVVVAAAAVSGAAGALPVDGLVALAGNDYFLLGTFGTLALGIVVVMLVRRAAGRVSQAAPPDPETIRDASRPGDELDAYLGSLAISNPRASSDAFQERLRIAAEQAMIRTEQIPREAACERVATGEWTDDQVVAAFLGEERHSTPTLHREASLALRGERWGQHEVRTAAKAVVDRFEQASESDRR